MGFDELYWHDSVIKKIEIDRNNPGKTDTILFEIDWYDIGIKKILFEDVYWLRMDMNFGVVAEESIYEAYIAPNDDIDIMRFNEKWHGILKDTLLCFIIKTASTGSEIKIIAKSCRVDK
ncbi:hypothetical protein FXV77_21780 [Sphingobacterium phlebotomi]|uniref:Uncharacterized protein n=1 Tax=Sphingobacterium phlebotomi TaxID=2605433 RepID=A0A5D4GR46_9SPHI|nr:hypothetical protein [Sphingobacterium phlebotomi]TYR30798.1 hypothetical protein FXV77_21780 [Sphingobacterium phlebotomi]